MVKIGFELDLGHYWERSGPVVECLTRDREAVVSWRGMMHACRALYIFEPVHEISNNVVCATSKGSDQPAHTRSLIRGFASRLSIL